MRTIAVIALKGGSGKTTVAMQMALAAHWRGHDAMVVDIDPQHSAHDILSAREEPGPGCVVSTGPKLLSAKFAAQGLNKDLLFVDTPAGAVEEVTEAIVLADYVILVVRPTLLDIAGLVRSFKLVKRLGKPCAVIVNQAPPAREDVEAPLVRRALRALEYMQAPLAPVILRSRAVYQTGLERGRSAEEMLDKAAAREVAKLWAYLAGEIARAPEPASVSADALPRPLTAYRPDPQFMTLGAEFADPVTPADFPKQILRFRNQRAAATVGLEGLTDAEWLDHFARFQPLPDNQPQPLAMRYHGHQFRSYNPDLGDGRGFLFAQLRDDQDRLLDLATKGSGQTPWSRSGDGRLTLKGGVREVLAAEMLQALGVPTSRGFSLVETGEDLTRGDEPSPTRSAVLTRLSHSHIRFGTFQRLAYLERADLIGQLLEHIADAYFPTLAPLTTADRAPALLHLVVERTAQLTAGWMAAGFVHGVLNTDNMQITGESFDYGPYRFLPRNDPNFVAAYFDQTGLYSFGRQPEAAFWNLQQLAAALTLVCDQERLIESLNGFEKAYGQALVAAMLRRLGLKIRGWEADVALVNAAFRALASGGEAQRWEPFFFDWFGGSASEARALAGVRRDLYGSDAFLTFRGLLQAYEAERPERLADPYFARPEPEELLIDEIEAIWSAIDQADDWAPFEAKIAAIRAAGAAYGAAGSSPT